MVKRFQRSARSGFYLAVLREGSISPGDRIERIPGPEPGVTVAEIAHLHSAEDPDPDLLRRASEIAALPEGWREHFRLRLGEPDA
jgi:MOSC domain-containing protein YiiM